MSYEIKQLSVGGILDQAIRVTKDGLGTFLGIVCCLFVPLQLVVGLTQIALMGDLGPNPTPEEIIAAQSGNTGLVIVGAVGGLLNIVIQPITTAALVFAVADVYVGESPTIGSSFRRALGRWLPLVWTTILYGLAVFAGLFLLIIPGIIAMLWFYLHQPVVILEKSSGFAALKRSRELMKGNLGKAFVIGFLTAIIVIGVSVSAQFVPQKHVAVIASGLLAGLAAIFYAAVTVVFYFSTRCEHEAYDLKRLAESIGVAEEAPAPNSALGM